ncbi:MAG: IS1595 family transposase, partial [Saprospiraceae bacterium]
SISRVNAIHSRLKRWLTKFNGVATKYLQNYLHYFRLWDKVKSFKERFYNFLQFSVQDNQAFIRVCDIR